MSKLKRGNLTWTRESQDELDITDYQINYRIDGTGEYAEMSYEVEEYNNDEIEPDEDLVIRRAIWSGQKNIHYIIKKEYCHD